MENKNQLLKIASVILIVFAVASFVISCINVFGSLGQFASDPAGQQALEQLEGSGVSAEQVMGIVNGTVYVVLAVSAIFTVLKVIVGILGIRKSELDGTGKFFQGWGIALLIFGILGLGSTFSLIGICNLLAGIAAPLLYIIFGRKKMAA